MTSEHHPANPVSNEDLLQDENAKLREQIDAARDAVAPIQSGLNQLKAALHGGTDYKARCRLAGDWLSELLEAGGEQLGTPWPAVSTRSARSWWLSSCCSPA